MSVPSGRRQSNRAVRSTAIRPQNYYARNSQHNAEPSTTNESAARTFPAIEHFTDTMAALPHDMARHMTMMTEVYAKLHAQEEDLAEIASEMSHLPKPTRAQPGTSNGPSSTEEAQRKSLMRRFNYRAFQMQPILDEKIAVLSAANLELSNLLRRAQSSYKHIPEEISAEARLGSSKHWAFVTEKETKKVGNERTRREVAAATTLGAALSGNLDIDATAARSEARREAMHARRIHNRHQDSDFEERANIRKQKGKGKQGEGNVTSESRPSPYIGTNGHPAQPKRKKPAAGTASTEKAMAGALNAQRKPPGSPSIGMEDKKKRKTAPGPAPPKKRVQTGEPKAPKPLSSPAVGTFNVERPSSQRGGGHSRGRHGSQAQVPQLNAPPILTEPSKSKQPTPVTTPTVAPSHAEEPVTTIPSGPELPTLEDAKVSDIELSKPPAQSDTIEALKDERRDSREPDPKTTAELVDNSHAPPQLTTNNHRNGRASKTSTPVTGTFPEPNSRGGSRTARTKEGGTATGSHASSESGQGERVQREKRKRIVSRKVDSGPHGDVEDGEDDDEEADGDEPLYCYCNEVSYGEMVACDNDQCVKQWFHLSCAGLSAAPTSAKWYCDDCKRSISRRGRRD